MISFELPNEFQIKMTLPPFHQPYSHRTRFKLVRSTTSLVKICRTKTIPSTPTNLVKNVPNRLTAPPLKAVSGTKYKWTPNTPKDANLNRSAKLYFEHKTIPFYYALVSSLIIVSQKKPQIKAVSLNGNY